MRRVPQQHTNFSVRRERDRRALRRQAWLLVCCVVLAAGFVWAARQQITAVQYGYRSEELRRERDRLLEDQRRLRFALEERSSPARLERSARALGLQPVRAAQIETTAERVAEEAAPAAAEHARTAFVGATTAGALRRR